MWKGPSMTAINAIAKVRFSSGRPQRVHLVDGQRVAAELLCLERGQEMPIVGPDAMLYVIGGDATLTQDDQTDNLSPGYLLALENGYTLANRDEQRLICLLFKNVS